LASQLTGWELNVMSSSDADKKAESEMGELIKTFMADLDVDEDVALILAQEGFSSLEEVAYVPEQEMLDIDEFDADIVAELRSRARDVLLTRAIASEEQLESAEPSQELLDMDGMSRDLALTLASQSVTTLDDLAELAVDELVDMGAMNEEQAAALIMKARESWFSGEQADAGE
jgi:N utilization substance protein A